MVRTLLLDTQAWDLVLDASGNIAVVDDPYATAQNVASALRTFKGEVYYDTTRGVPYFESILGQYPSAPLLKSAFQTAALSVSGVQGATAFLSYDRASRTVSGQVQVTTTSGVTIPVGGAFAPRPQPGSAWPAGQYNFSDPRQSGWVPGV